MSGKRKALFVLSSAVAPLLWTAPGMGGLTITAYTGTVTGTAPGNYWPSSPTGPAPASVVGLDPVITSCGTPVNPGNSDGQPNLDGQTPVNEGVGSGSFSVLSQTFTTGATGFTLGEIAFAVAGGGNGNGTNPYSIHLFQLNSSVTAASTGYTLSTAEVGHDLFGSGSGLSFGLATPGAIEQFVFSGADEVALQPSTVYAIELWGDQNTTAGTFYIRPSGADTPAQPYTGGQAYQIGTTTNAGQSDNSSVVRGEVAVVPRDLLFALYPAGATLTTGTWTGAAVNANDWSTAGNWSGGIPGANPGDSALFPSTVSSVNPNLNGNRTLGSLTFNGPAYTLAQGSSGTLTMNNNGLNRAYRRPLWEFNDIRAGGVGFKHSDCRRTIHQHVHDLRQHLRYRKRDSLGRQPVADGGHCCAQRLQHLFRWNDNRFRHTAHSANLNSRDHQRPADGQCQYR